MHNWFQCKVKYEKNAQDGGIVKTSEAYLVDALSFTEAEERINEEMRPFISGNFWCQTSNGKKLTNFSPTKPVIAGYRSKVNFISLDEEKGVEKRIATTMYAQASSVKEALEVIEKGMKGTLADCKESPQLPKQILWMYSPIKQNKTTKFSKQLITTLGQMSIAQNIQEIRKNIPANVSLVCVSKFHPENAILEAYNCGERIFN